MRGTRGIVAFLAINVIVIAAVGDARAQVRRAGPRTGPGSTVAGDVLRGEGAYLRGLGYYELNDARAASINVDTQKKIDDWNAQYLKDYSESIAAKRAHDKAKSRDLAAKADRQRAETEYRLRTNPKPAEIYSGAALNALLIDLSNPTFGSAEWRSAKVPLPKEITIAAMIFQFLPKPGAKGSNELEDSLISLGRLDIEGEKWPIALSDEKLANERKAYETAYHKIVEQCQVHGLKPDVALGLRKPIDALKKKADTVVPAEGGFRASSSRFLTSMEKASGMFHADTVDFAQDMIQDVKGHEAESVGELLAFMRKYRLLFAPADERNSEIYQRLYGILREQKKVFGIKDEPPVEVATQPMPEKNAAKDPKLTVNLTNKIGEARRIADGMRFPKHPACRPHKTAAVAALDSAAKDVGGGRSPVGYLTKAAEELGEILKLSTGPANTKNTKASVKLIQEAIALAK